MEVSYSKLISTSHNKLSAYQLDILLVLFSLMQVNTKKLNMITSVDATIKNSDLKKLLVNKNVSNKRIEENLNKIKKCLFYFEYDDFKEGHYLFEELKLINDNSEILIKINSLYVPLILK